MRAVFAIVALAACGRFGFDPEVPRDVSEIADAHGDAADAHGDAADTPDGPQGPTWNLVQVVGTTSSSLTIAATGSDHLIVVGIQMQDTDSVTSVTDNAGNQYVRIPMAHATDATGGDGLDVWYAAPSLSGANSIVVSGPLILYAIVGWEFAGIDTVNALDTAAGLNDQPASLAPVSPTVTTSQTGELVVAMTVVVNDVTGLSAGNEFTSDSLANLSGWAHITSHTAPAGPHFAQWDHTSNTPYLSSAISFRRGP